MWTGGQHGGAAEDGDPVGRIDAQHPVEEEPGHALRVVTVTFVQNAGHEKPAEDEKRVDRVPTDPVVLARECPVHVSVHNEEGEKVTESADHGRAATLL